MRGCQGQVYCGFNLLRDIPLLSRKSPTLEIVFLNKKPCSSPSTKSFLIFDHSLILKAS